MMISAVCVERYIFTFEFITTSPVVLLQGEK